MLTRGTTTRTGQQTRGLLLGARLHAEAGAEMRAST